MISSFYIDDNKPFEFDYFRYMVTEGFFYRNIN